MSMNEWPFKALHFVVACRETARHDISCHQFHMRFEEEISDAHFCRNLGLGFPFSSPF